MAYPEHHRASEHVQVRCAVITLSDTRTEQNDSSGRTIRDLLTGAGHHVAHYQIIRDEPADLEGLLKDLLARDSIDAVLTNGGTGISRRDQTIPTIQKYIDQPLPGFGELFRLLSWEQIGSGAMLSRAAAGISRGKPIFSMPGSTKAVELAMTRLILPEIKHLVFELHK